jgi:hypothetical protein
MELATSGVLDDPTRVKLRATPAWLGFTTRSDKQMPIRQPRPAFGENGQPKLRPQRRLELGIGEVPMRIPVEYNYAEQFGLAEVGYLFRMGKRVILASGGTCLIEHLKLGMQFQLQGGGFATITKVEAPIPWPELHPTPDRDGNVRRRILGRVKHIGYISLEVTFAGVRVVTTPGHRFKTLNRSWVVATDLRQGDTLQGIDDSPLSVESIKLRRGFVELYNFEVEISHTYYVMGTSLDGRQVSVLVHNGLDCIKLPEYEQEAVDEGGLSVRSPRELGLNAPEDHHVFPQEYRSWFEQRGVNIDDFTVTPEGWEHDLIHGPLEWNDAIMSKLSEAELAKGSPLTPAEIRSIGDKMLERLQLDHLPVHPYGG